MPYNRLIQSAGKVITYGNPALENHALDVTILPQQIIAVEDRYGMALLDTKTNKIQTRWSFADSANYKDVISTYSGICSFVYDDTTYVVWGAQGEKKDRGFVVIAAVKNQSVTKVSFIQCSAAEPAKLAIP